jgi:hypothetical protein
MVNGQLVNVRLFGGSTAVRRVVSIKRDVIVVCADEEYQAALSQGREPTGLGFPPADVIGPAEIMRRGASSEISQDDEYLRSNAGD